MKVQGEACGRIQEGSGFFVAGDVVVTNAHVVAGEDDTDVELSDGSWLDAEAVSPSTPTGTWRSCTPRTPTGPRCR